MKDQDLSCNNQTEIRFDLTLCAKIYNPVGCEMQIL
jgi:hypothetical protein